jgi:hypothetical protein
LPKLQHPQLAPAHVLASLGRSRSARVVKTNAVDCRRSLQLYCA